MQNLTPLEGTPLNLLFVAINHYVSTGDHIGEGIAQAEGPQRKGEPLPNELIQILILVNPALPTDTADFTKFKSRFSELEKEFSTRLESHGRQDNFLAHSFTIRYRQCESLTQALTEKPGPLGWGSMKPLIDQHFPG